MSPEERQLLTGLFDRTRNAAATPRDPEAEALISEQVRTQPFAPYLLAQAVLVQEQALTAANEKLQAQEARLQELEQQAGRGAPAAPAGSGFLSGLGSLFGAGAPPPRGPAPGAWQQQPPQGFGQQNYPPPQGFSPGPWGQAAPPQGGGFLKGALGAAAGVAGGVLLADSIRGLFGGHSNPLGIGSGLGGFNPGMGGETVVNNYYDNSNPASHDAKSTDAADRADDRADDAADASYDDPGTSNDDSFDV
jgi:hypothetical protein